MKDCKGEKMSSKINELQTSKNDLTQTRIESGNLDSSNLEKGEILVNIERFAFTANNITYGLAGDMMGYWKFFPSLNDSQDEWGCIPMWGFAKVIHSNNENIKIDERLFGYFPASNSIILNPIKVTDQSLTDGKDHRKELPPVYNNYIRLSGEENYDSKMDNLRALLFPLHITSFCLCDALQNESYLGASQVIIVSASSKTGIGLAQGLKDEDEKPKIIGLTASKNIDFVESLGCYDEVISYNQLEKVNSDIKSVMVDMAGNREILGTLHDSLKDNMLKCITVGMTHWDSETTAEDALGQLMIRDRTEFFFAPDHIQKRISDWGSEGYNQRTSAFMNTRAKQSIEWMNIKEISGLHEFVKTYDEVIRGHINPDEGIIVIP